ncbi:helix-turn-helix domain-containing protein [Flavobacterium restrictum]|uniref:helix-turn-helix domain-containing protein n=1 Tax=Flavobacterium restrictum TaxID=2594428 RepID=UPI0021D263C3|nr:helix-turn-helix transcriptional regulator [Flavobacterium restrictum]
MKKLRKLNGFTLEEICEQLSISPSTYTRMEKGETATWTSMIDKICGVYKIEPEELLLSEEKYILINNNQNGGSTTLTGNIINNLSEKVIELYDKMLVEKDIKIADLEKKVSNKI